MAVIKMKRVSVIGAIDAREQLLEELMDLGVVHIEPLTPTGDSPSELTSRLAAANKAALALKARRAEKKLPRTDGTNQPPEEVLSRALKLIGRKAELDAQLASLQKERQLAEPWGELTSLDLRLLNEQGANLVVGQLPTAQLKPAREILDSAAWWTTVPIAGGRTIGVAALYYNETPDALSSLLEETALPIRTLSMITAELATVKLSLDRLDGEIDQLATRSAGPLTEAQNGLRDQLTFAEVQSSLGGDEEIFALSGWCPDSEVEAIKKLPNERPVAVMISDPSADDIPPICLKNNKFVSFFEPLLKAFNLPHYQEGDPTVLFAPFMALFFGFCLGDVAYGLLLFFLASFAARKFNPQGELRKAVRLMQVLGASATLMGVLTGMFFGEKYYAILGLSDQSLMFFLSENPAQFFYLSLGLGAAQLTLGMLVKLGRLLNRRKFQEAIATVGWLSLLPGVALWAMEGLPFVFWTGAGLVVLFSSPNPNVLKRLGGGAWAFYNISGLFGDVMSYARIFGLGLSTGIIGHVINIIAFAAGDTPYVGWLFTSLILVVGHTFNFAMAVIGSVVHPARLQFLEFFGKFFEGGGEPYRPFGRAQGG